LIPEAVSGQPIAECWQSGGEIASVSISTFYAIPWADLKKIMEIQAAHLSRLGKTVD
jgi:hypothetical protein